MSETSTRRLQVIARQMAQPAAMSPDGIAVVPCSSSAAVRTLPRFDPYILETYLDDLRELKRQVYDLFKYKPELLPHTEEGLTKGQT